MQSAGNAKSHKDEIMQKTPWIILSIFIISAFIHSPLYADEADDLIAKMEAANGFGRAFLLLQEQAKQNDMIKDEKFINYIIDQGKEANYELVQGYLINFMYWKDASVEILLKDIRSNDIKRRRFAAKALGFAASTVDYRSGNIEKGINDERALQPLMAALTDEDKVVRMNAACSLGMMGKPNGLEIALKGLEDKNWEVVDAAADALGWIGDKRGLSALERLHDEYKKNKIHIDKEKLIEIYDKKEDEYVSQTLAENINRIKLYGKK